MLHIAVWYYMSVSTGYDRIYEGRDTNYKGGRPIGTLSGLENFFAQLLTDSRMLLKFTISKGSDYPKGTASSTFYTLGCIISSE